MRFLVDAQLPARLARALLAAGHDAIHTTVLPTGNRTSDAEITDLVDREDRVVVTKDRDFHNGHLLEKRPRHLLIVLTGNVTNSALLELIEGRLEAIDTADADFVELGTEVLVVHPRSPAIE